MALSILEIDSFGGTAAEDDDLKRFFVKTPAFDQIWRGDKNIVIGRKGSGKTALYLALAERARAEDLKAASLSFAQYPWKAHYKYASPEVTNTERFVDSWRFLILAEALSLLVERPPDPLTRQQARTLGEVEKFLRHNYGSVHFDFKSAFPTGGLRLEGLDAEPGFAGARLGKASIIRSGEALGSSLGRINEWLYEKARDLSSVSGTTFVLFDELDLGFNPQDADYRDRVIGLLLAARRFASDGRNSGLGIRPVVFLRSDIFDLLHFGDKNKIRLANSVELVWHDRLDYREASLKHLLDWRIKESLEIDDVEKGLGARV